MSEAEERPDEPAEERPDEPEPSTPMEEDQLSQHSTLPAEDPEEKEVTENGDIPTDSTAIDMEDANSNALDGTHGSVDGMMLDGLAAARAFSQRTGKEARKKRREKLFFSDDPSCRIDYIITYVDTDNSEKLAKRANYEKNLEEEGVLIERESKEDSVDGKTNFLKLHATWDAVATGAELLNMRKRIKMPKEMSEQGESCCTCDPCGPNRQVVPEEDDYFTAPFHADSIDMFDVDAHDPEALANFFTNAERSLVVKELLDRTAFTAENEHVTRFGINKLLNENVYEAAYPLHEGRIRPLPEDETPWEGKDKDRARLHESWARWGKWYAHQPLDLIRKYFGEKIAIYFAWLGYYTSALVPAAIVGIAVFLYGVCTFMDDVPSGDICDKSGVGNITMCPKCDRVCPYRKLYDSCIYSQLTYVFDNYATVAFAAFMAIWASCFLEFWKRYENSIQYEWDVANFELDERMRPEFEFKVKQTRINPITSSEEPYLPLYSRCPRYLTSYTVILFMVCLVGAAIFGVILYRIVIIVLINKLPELSAYGSIVVTITAAVINLVIIIILNLVYGLIAKALTNFEMHRTETEYEDSLIFKIFLFKFVNFYGSVFYIAFFKGSFVDRPGDTRHYLFGAYRPDECDPAGCIVDLFLQLGIIMVGKQTINNAKELILPWFLTWWKSKKSKKGETRENLYMRWEQDNDLRVLDRLGLFEEYLEMVIQFGFVTIFVAAFPLAPFFALLNNVIEIRLDAFKFVSIWRRPPANKAQDIGIWNQILRGLSFIAILSNAFIIGWTSEFVPRMVYQFGPNGNENLTGYMENSLSIFATADFSNDTAPENPDVGKFGVVDYCSYKGYRYPPGDPLQYEYTTDYWLIFTARLAFVIVFEHLCFVATWMLVYLIPDTPTSVNQLRIYEKQLVKKLTFDQKFLQLKEKRSKASFESNNHRHFSNASMSY